jgi:hypothetical protein
MALLVFFPVTARAWVITTKLFPFFGFFPRQSTLSKLNLTEFVLILHSHNEEDQWTKE